MLLCIDNQCIDRVAYPILMGQGLDIFEYDKR